jgi:hypothetical protein
MEKGTIRVGFKLRKKLVISIWLFAVGDIIVQRNAILKKDGNQFSIDL